MLLPVQTVSIVDWVVVSLTLAVAAVSLIGEWRGPAVLAPLERGGRGWEQASFQPTRTPCQHLTTRHAVSAGALYTVPWRGFIQRQQGCTAADTTGGFNTLWSTRASLQLLGAGYALSLCLRLQVRGGRQIPQAGSPQGRDGGQRAAGAMRVVLAMLVRARSGPPAFPPAPALPAAQPCCAAALRPSSRPRLLQVLWSQVSVMRPGGYNMDTLCR